MLSSTSSLSSSTHSSAPGSSAGITHVTRIYKQASQLFLTRRVSEALQVLDLVILPPSSGASSTGKIGYEENSLDDEQSDNDNFPIKSYVGSSDSNGIGDTLASHAWENTKASSNSQAPIATASRPARVKVWSLYISILNSIMEMEPEEGKSAFGAARYGELVKSVKEGTVWDDVVRWGYRGNGAAVDADIISNLATLLLAQADSQKPTQARLEAYLSSTSGMPSASALQSQIERSSNPSAPHTFPPPSQGNGTSTPRDLGSKQKILEIYALYVLPANEEWDYAKEFINLSEILDEERREALISALESLREERSVESRKERELAAQRVREQEAEEERQRRDAEANEKRAREEKVREAGRRQEQDRAVPSNSSKPGTHKIDYGVDKSGVSGTSRTYKAPNGTNRAANSSAAAAKKPRAAGPTLYRRATLMLTAVHQSLLHFGSNMSRHPVAVLRMLLFLSALIMALARQDVRQRLKNARDTAWDKVKKTIGMGVKVSYI